MLAICAAHKVYRNPYNKDVDTSSFSDLRANLAKVMDRVCDDNAPLIITRQGRKSVVMMSLEDFEALDETAFLARSPKNAKRLSDAIQRLNAGGGVSVDSSELAS